MTEDRAYYPIEDQIRDCYAYLGMGRPDLENATEEDLHEHERFLEKYFEWVEHPRFIQFVPKHRRTGRILCEWKADMPSSHKTIKS